MIIDQTNRHTKEKSLSKKIVYIIAIFILVCSITWGLFLVRNVKQNVIDSNILEEEAFIERVNSSVNTTSEVCSLATQIVTQSTNLMDYFKNVKNNKDVGTIDKKEFYDKDVAMLEDLTNANPYLYQVRIYVDSENITEKMPNIYIEGLGLINFHGLSKDIVKVSGKLIMMMYFFLRMQLSQKNIS